MPAKLSASLATALATALLAGCENAPPGAGVTNGPPPSVLGAEDKPAVRSDLREPAPTGGDAAVAASVPPGPDAAVPGKAATPEGNGKGSSSRNPQ